MNSWPCCPEGRILASLVALLLYALEGHMDRHAAFGSHAARLVSFLENADLSVLEEDLQICVTEVLATLKDGRVIRGDWLKIVRHYLLRGRLRREFVWEEVQHAKRKDRQGL